MASIYEKHVEKFNTLDKSNETITVGIKADVDMKGRSISDELDKFDTAVYPEQFGAKGDGVTDDTNAFIQAVAYCKASSSTHTYIKIIGKINAQYVITGFTGEWCTIQNCRFKGKNGYSTNGIKLGSRCFIENCLFESFGDAIYTTTNDACVYSGVKRCTFSWSYNGIHLATGVSSNYSVDNIVLENNYAVNLGVLGHSSHTTPPNWDNTGCGIWLQGNWKNIIIKDNVLEYNAHAGLRLECDNINNSPSAIIIGNYFEGNKVAGVYCKWPNRPCGVYIDNNNFINVNNNVFVTNGIYHVSGLTYYKLASHQGERIGLAYTSNVSDIQNNTLNLKASNLTIMSTDLVENKISFIPTKCTISSGEYKYLNLSGYVESVDSISLNIQYLDNDNEIHSKTVALNPNEHFSISMLLTNINTFDDLIKPFTFTFSGEFSFISFTDSNIQ